MPIYWLNDIPAGLGRPTRCTHQCACGATLTCNDPDRCVIAQSQWTCPSCDIDAIDQWLPQYEQERAR